jgi:Na+-translocating ferredoxin:NAD+ oxidoreductase subunit C
MYLFTGRGVELPQEKNSSLQGEIQKLSLSSRLEVPLYTLGRTQLELTVGMGEPIRKYAPLALSPSRNHAILSPVSGKLMGVDSRIHPLLGKVPCALIQADPEGEEEKIRPQWETGMGYDKLERIAKEAGIVDETDHFPLYRKLRALRQSGINLVVASALDDDPYVTSGMAVVRAWGEEVVQGLELLDVVCPNAIGILALYDPGSCAAVDSVPEQIRNTEVLRVSGKYPLWPALEKKWRGQKIACIGVQALRALSRAAFQGEAMADVVLTVAGNAVRRPRNVQVPVGTPVEHVLKQCGARDVRWISGGNAMTGYPIEDIHTPVLPGMRCVLAMSSRPWARAYSCIGCGKCIEACPKKLMPFSIAQLYERGEREEAGKYGADRCIGCGACSAVCPAGIELSAIMRRAADRGKRHHEEWGKA